MLAVPYGDLPGGEGGQLALLEPCQFPQRVPDLAAAKPRRLGGRRPRTTGNDRFERLGGGRMGGVTADMSKLPTGAAGWAALVDHALSLGDLSEVDHLELKTTLPFGDRPDRKRSGALLARQVLGFGNRMPDVAAQHLSGYAVVLVGVSDGKVTGAEEVDGTVLHDAVHPFLGDKGPHWDHQYIAHPDGRVLAIVIDPPQWGDPVFSCVKDFGDSDARTSLRDGDVYVRVRGRTRLATSHDLANLGSRRDRAPAADAKVLIQYDGEFDRVDTDSAVALVEHIVEQQAASLLAELKTGATGSAAASSFKVNLPAFSIQQDQRSPAEFSDAVEVWHRQAKAQAEHVATEFLRHRLGKGRFRIVNDSDRYLEAVRVEVQFPDDVRVLAGSNTDYCDHGGQFRFFSLLPDPPPRWGSLDRYRILSPNMSRPLLKPSPWQSDIEVEDTASGPLVRWTLGDLRPRASERCAEMLAILTDAHYSRIDICWRATARGINHVFVGQSTVTCAQEAAYHLTFQPAQVTYR